MTPAVLALLILGALAILFVWLIAQERRNQTMIAAQVAARQRERYMAKCLAIEEDLMAWLKMLELPALEEQTRLEAAGRQLRIVLVERLMNGPRVH